jgi:hypothetical protein
MIKYLSKISDNKSDIYNIKNMIGLYRFFYRILSDYLKAGDLHNDGFIEKYVNIEHIHIKL